MYGSIMFNPPRGRTLTVRQLIAQLNNCPEDKLDKPAYGYLASSNFGEDEGRRVCFTCVDNAIQNCTDINISTGHEEEE